MEETWPKEIPRSSEWIKQAASREDVSWKEVDDYYQNELKSREEKGEENPALINNLKAMTLSTLIQRTDFLNQASMERLIFYIVDLSVDADNESGNIGDYAQLVRSCKERGLDEYQEFKVRKFVTKGFRRYIAIHETRENVNYDYEEKYAEDIAFLKTMRRR
ncbi:MAG: hypothetical protein GVX78_05050 [Bacteroidetes bacterium]|jgi:hypothetical protein|nr:hypothetical protein [Bacteroidota bacterium]